MHRGRSGFVVKNLLRTIHLDLAVPPLCVSIRWPQPVVRVPRRPVVAASIMARAENLPDVCSALACSALLCSQPAALRQQVLQISVEPAAGG